MLSKAHTLAKEERNPSHLLLKASCFPLMLPPKGKPPAIPLASSAKDLQGLLKHADLAKPARSSQSSSTQGRLVSVCFFLCRRNTEAVAPVQERNLCLQGNFCLIDHITPSF